jgi:hypothetical protein
MTRHKPDFDPEPEWNAEYGDESYWFGVFHPDIAFDVDLAAEAVDTLVTLVTQDDFEYADDSFLIYLADIDGDLIDCIYLEKNRDKMIADIEDMVKFTIRLWSDKECLPLFLEDYAKHLDV